MGRHQANTPILTTACALLFIFLGAHVGAFVPANTVVRDSKIALIAPFRESSDTKDRETIEAMKQKITLPFEAKIDPRRVVNLMRPFREKSNKVLFRIFDLLIEKTPDVDLNMPTSLNFCKEEELDNVLYYQTKPQFFREKMIDTFYYVLKDAPKLVAEAGTVDIEGLVGKKIFPYGRMMMSDNTEDCFIRQKAAFCTPEKGDSGRVVCDLSYFEEKNPGSKERRYPVKPEARDTPGYGGRAIVENDSIVEISGVRKGDKEFESRKAAFLASFAVHVVYVRHAVMAHLCICQRLLVKLTAGRSNAYEEAWNTNAGPTLFLAALTYRTNEVSINEQLLVGHGNSLVGRAASLTNDALVLLGSDAYDKFSIMTGDELVADVGQAGSAQWNKACTKAWKGAQAAVKVICKDVSDKFEKDDLDGIALVLWTSTFYHAFIGDFQLDNLCKGNLMFALGGENDLAYGTLATTIGATTMTRTMNLVTLKGYLPEKEQRDAWGKYMDLLEEVSGETGIPGYSLASPVYVGVNF
jgi:hypothetical protein